MLNGKEISALFMKGFDTECQRIYAILQWIVKRAEPALSCMERLRVGENRIYTGTEINVGTVYGDGGYQ